MRAATGSCPGERGSAGHGQAEATHLHLLPELLGTMLGKWHICHVL